MKHGLTSLVLLLLALSVGFPAMAQVLAGSVTARGQARSLAIDIPMNKSDVIRADRPFAEVAVGNPEVADIQVLGDRSLYVFARRLGSTSVTLTGDNGTIIAVVEVNVTHDVSALKQLLHAVMPRQRIGVRAANDGIVLTGTVSSSSAAANAVVLAERFAPGAVANLMRVEGSQQVLLAVRFVEMRRDTLKRLGVNATGSIGDNFSIFGALQNIAAQPASIAELGIDLVSGANTFRGLLDVLEEKGVVRTLAEPNLVALSGDSADFLAGGEFPIPVAADDGQITIEFKNFGVGLAFTPTVLASELINLRLSMEVSEPDQTNAVELVGVEIPGLTVRRATTTVELYNGQSFAIAGLLQESFADTVRQVPFLGDLPILGALLRSTQYQNGQSELVMIVTPYLAQPTTSDRLSVPELRAPSERELFVDGRLERGPPAPSGDGGLAGPHGYALR